MQHEDWTPPRINAWANGYWASCALHAAVRLGVTAQLAQGPVTAGQLAARLEIDARGLAMLLTVLLTLDLLNLDNGKYAMVPEAAPFFTPGGPADMTNIILHNAHLVDNWTRLDQAIRQGGPVGGDWTPEQSGHFYLGMRDVSRRQAPGLAARLGLEPDWHLLDLGGGPGVYGYTFADETPGLKVTVFDLPDSRESFEQEAAGRPQAANVDRLDGDYRVDAVGGPFDAVWISHVLHGEGPEDAGALLAKASAALRPGGVVWVQEFMVDYQGGGHPFAALFSLNMLLGTQSGKAYSEEELTKFMSRVGLEDIEVIGPTVPGAPSRLMKGVRRD